MIHVAVNSWFWNRPDTGSGQYTRKLVEHLDGSGLEITRFSPGSTKRSQIADSRSQSATSKVWFEQVTFPRACRRIKAHIAHVPYWAPPMAPLIPTIVTIHDLIPLVLREYRGGLAVRLYTSMVSAAAQNAALVLTDSESSRQDILIHLKLPPERVRVVYLAADTVYRPDPAPDDVAIRTHYGLPDRYTLYLGGCDVRKNVNTALRAYTWAGRALEKDCPLVIAGRLPQQDTAFTPDPRRQAQELGLDPDWVHFAGQVAEEHKPALYRGAVTYLYPSRYEGFGLPALEAIACGVPVVGSHATSIPEVVGNAGVLLDPDDAAGMAGAVIQLAQDRAFRDELRQRALAQAANFSWQKTARETLAAYQDVLSP